jgi:hypothetical protein
MIVRSEEIEQIEHTLQEFTRSAHAEAFYRDIVTREKERQKHEKRWFWELLQNAKDSVEENQKIKVILEITDDQVSFSHTGNPFELEEISALIIQGTTKTEEEGKTGQFGTGFITTYLLSREVNITGEVVLVNNKRRYFQFLLNRNANDSKRLCELQQESIRQFKESFSDKSYLGDSEFQTKFTYKLNDRGKEIAKIGLKCLNELIPITLIFNEQFDTVTVIENETITTFSKSPIQKHEAELVSEWRVDTIVDKIPVTSIEAYLHKNEQFETCIITQKKDGIETIFRLTNDHPRLFYTFPLIGTEEIGIPIIINSTSFDPKVERDGIYLKLSEDENNKKIIREALLTSLKLFSELFITKYINGIFELFGFNCDKEFEWIDNTWFTTIKKEAIDSLASGEIIQYDDTGNNRTCLLDLNVPFLDKEENLKELWKLLSETKDIKVPLIGEFPNWIEIIKNIAPVKGMAIYDLPFVFGINRLIDQFVGDKNSLAELEKVIKTDVHDWLNGFYSLIIKEKGSFPLDKKIALNQRGMLIKAENISWDKCNDDDLILVSNLVGLNFSDKLFSRKIDLKHNIHGVNDFNIDNAKNKLLSKLNEFTEKNINDNSSYQECNARFLKWLISKNDKDTIKNLKIISGADENFYGHFPESEHLLLTPKAYFRKDFPFYANLIRDKDCLNDVYNEILTEEDYKYLSENNFIHLRPLVVKEVRATIRLLKDLDINENDLSQLIDSDGQLKNEFKITFSDFAYLTTTSGHIYDRNLTQKSSMERLKFFLVEAVEKDIFFDVDTQRIEIEGIESPIKLRQCLWVSRAKRLNWINIKNEAEDTEKKFSSETPSSKNLSELLKGDDALIKTIRGEKQQLFLKKLGVSVSDLIRNTLLSDKESESWDKAITSMITSGTNPKLVMAMCNDPNIKKVYEKRIRDKELIDRNQAIGKLIEDLFKEYIGQIGESGTPVCIERKPFGSDYILTEESSDLVNDDDENEMFKINDWLVELKATGKEYAAMTQLQAKTANENKETYALIVVPLDGTEPDINYLKKNARVVNDIGSKIDAVYDEFNKVETKKNDLSNGKDGISVNYDEDHKIRFRISSDVWNEKKKSIEEFIAENFQVKGIRPV